MNKDKLIMRLNTRQHLDLKPGMSQKPGDISAYHHNILKPCFSSKWDLINIEFMLRFRIIDCDYKMLIEFIYHLTRRHFCHNLKMSFFNELQSSSHVFCRCSVVYRGALSYFCPSGNNVMRPLSLKDLYFAQKPLSTKMYLSDCLSLHSTHVTTSTDSASTVCDLILASHLLISVL